MLSLKRFTNWERWHFKIIYAPLTPLWLYYMLKARAVWFFSNVNPTLEFAGFEGEPKQEMYAHLPPGSYPETLYVQPQQSFDEVLLKLEQSNIAYPFIVKPDVGMQGLLVRRIANQQELEHYHNHMPADYLIQQLIDLPLEFSVFYIRYPDEQNGKITGFILKEYLQVKGDGLSTLLQLIQQHPKAKYREAEMKARHDAHLDRIIPCGENYILSITGNHNRGARFINMFDQIDEQLCTVFDELSTAAKQFYYGRYDVKCTSLEDLKAGKNVCVLEFNGAGAEPNHVYDCSIKYTEALKEIARHWKDLYAISKINKSRGYTYWDFIKGYRYLRNAKQFFKMLKKYDRKQ